VISKFHRKWVVLGILFLLPVIFLLFLYPSTNNYNTLDIVQEDIYELDSLNFVDNNSTTLENNIRLFKFFLESLPKHLLKNPFKKIFLVSRIIDFEIFDFSNKQILVEVFPISPII